MMLLQNGCHLRGINYKVRSVDTVTANRIWNTTKEIIITLRHMVVIEYNSNILNEFEKITNRKLQKINDLIE